MNPILITFEKRTVKTGGGMDGWITTIHNTCRYMWSSCYNKQATMQNTSAVLRHTVYILNRHAKIAKQVRPVVF